MVALRDLHCNFLFSRQMICKQYIVLTHVLFPEVISNPLQLYKDGPDIYRFLISKNKVHSHVDDNM